MKLVAGVLVVLCLVGCGTGNQALKVEYPYRTVTQDNADETFTLVKIATDAVVVTEYNTRYTLTVTAPAGEYRLRGMDSSGGRYFAPHGNVSVTLLYGGVTVLGTPKPESVSGGIHVDSQGQTSLFWFWGSDNSNPVRIPAPRISVTISKEIDRERTRARQEREERERRAKATQLAEEEKRQALAAALAAAQTRDRVQCAGAQQCERAFAQAQAYLLKQADMRIQVATPTLIETHNATSDGLLQMRLLRIPTTDDRWEIVISAHCRDERKDSDDRCMKKLIEAYTGFLPHMQRQ